VRWFVCLLSLSFVLGLGCERKRGEITGIGDYEIGKTRLEQSGGACSPHKKQTWCTGLVHLKIGEQTASVDLYFGGHDDKSVLVEILLGIHGCDVGSAKSALQHELGKADEVLDNRLVWNYKRTVIVARVPLEKKDTECEVSFVHPLETRTIEYLRTGVMPPDPDAEKKAPAK